MNDVVDAQDLAINFEEWLEYAKTAKTEPRVELHTEAMRFLSTSPSITGFMTKPVAMYQENTIEAKTVKSNSLREIKQFLDTTENQIFPYQLLYIPSQIGFGYFEPTTMKFIKIVDDDGNPSYAETPSYWLFRYAEV